MISAGTQLDLRFFRKKGLDKNCVFFLANYMGNVQANIQAFKRITLTIGGADGAGASRALRATRPLGGGWACVFGRAGEGCLFGFLMCVYFVKARERDGSVWGRSNTFPQVRRAPPSAHSCLVFLKESKGTLCSAFPDLSRNAGLH